MKLLALMVACLVGLGSVALYRFWDTGSVHPDKKLAVEYANIVSARFGGGDVVSVTYIARDVWRVLLSTSTTGNKCWVIHTDSFSLLATATGLERSNQC